MKVKKYRYYKDSDRQRDLENRIEMIEARLVELENLAISGLSISEEHEQRSLERELDILKSKLRKTMPKKDSKNTDTEGENSMKIKFKNGYTVEVTDTAGMTKNQIYKEAYEAMIATKRINDAKKKKDSKPSITYKSNMLSHISKLKSAIDKKTGEVLDPEALDYEIKNIEIDMDADLNHENWHKKYMPEALKTIVDDYQKYIDVLKLAKDEKYVAKVAELEAKLKEIKELFKVVDEIDDVVEDTEVRDVPVAEPTASYSLNPDPYFSVDNIDDANAYLISRDPQKKAAAVKILKNEFPAIRKNLESDIENADEFVGDFNKDQLRIFMETYKNIIDVYNAAGLMAEYRTLDDLYKELYYNALHLSRKGGRTISGSKSVVARRGK